MKKLTIMLLALLLLWVSCLTVFAEAPQQKGAAISTTVPAYCEVTFLSSGGRIEVNGRAVHERESFDRRTEQTLHILSDEGKEIEQVLFGGEDVTSQVRDGYFTTPPLVTDTVIEVLYRDAPIKPSSVPSEPEQSVIPSPKPEQPRTDDPAAPAGLLAVTLVAALVIVLSSGRKHRHHRPT